MHPVPQLSLLKVSFRLEESKYKRIHILENLSGGRGLNAGLLTRSSFLSTQTACKLEKKLNI